MSSPPRPSTRRGAPERRDAVRRRQLLDAGLAIFGTTGYASSRIPDVCSRAGVGTTSFYSEFETKEDLLLAVYDEVLERVGTAFGGALARPVDDVAEHVTVAIGAFITAATQDERAARVQLLEVVAVSPRVERHRREVLRGFARVMVDLSAAYAAAGLVARPITPAAGLAVVGAVNELLIEWALERGPHRPSPVTIRRTVEALTLGLLDPTSDVPAS